MITIYKKDTKGKSRYLKAWTQGPKLYQESGVVGTDSPIVHDKICTAKNVGRSNETHPDDQAISEMNSLIDGKLTEGYFKTLKEAETETVILPMLAKSYGDEKKKIDWLKCYGQPKLDGMRALGDKSLISREGKLIETVPFISEVLKDIPFHLDGELYAHGLSFQENMKLIKKYRKGESENIRYHVYDQVSNEPFVSRWNDLIEFFVKNDNIYGHLIVVVPTVTIKNETELAGLHARNIQYGYEGTIVRWGDTPYKPNGRSSNLLKYKDFLDLAAEIIDIEPAEQRPEWGVPVFKYNGKVFRAGMKYSHAEREEFLRNKKKYIGKIGELRFFEWTDDGIPRFPVMVGVRLDKTKQD